VHVAVGVDARRDQRRELCQCGHRHPFIGSQPGQGWPQCRDGGQDREGPLRQAPMRSRSPDRCVPVGLRTRPTVHIQGNRSASR
jgi:hypothetical protein